MIGVRRVHSGVHGRGAAMSRPLSSRVTPMSDPRTPRGRGTRERIVAVAAALMYEHGVTAVSLEDVLAASRAGKGQFYHYFSSRDELVADVLRHQLDQVLREHRSFDLGTWEGVHAWLESMVGMQENQRDFRGLTSADIA